MMIIKQILLLSLIMFISYLYGQYLLQYILIIIPIEIYNIIIIFIVILIQMDNFILYNDFSTKYNKKIIDIEYRLNYIELNNINIIKLMDIINNIKNKKDTTTMRSSHSCNQIYNNSS